MWKNYFDFELVLLRVILGEKVERMENAFPFFFFFFFAFFADFSSTTSFWAAAFAASLTAAAPSSSTAAISWFAPSDEFSRLSSASPDLPNCPDFRFFLRIAAESFLPTPLVLLDGCPAIASIRFCLACIVSWQRFNCSSFVCCGVLRAAVFFSQRYWKLLVAVAVTLIN